MQNLIHKGDFRRLKADECIALADFWLDEAVRTFTNEATRAICINEAQHWLDLAEDIRLGDANQTRREAAALAGALSAELLPQTKTPGDRSNLGKSPASNRSQF